MVKRRAFLYASLFLYPLFLFASELAVYVFPSMIYDDEHCPLYRDHASELTFVYYYRGEERILDLASSGSQLFLEVPVGVSLLESNVMDGWKKPFTQQVDFTSSPCQRDGMEYRRYALQPPKTVLQPALRQPLPGGMFGASSNNHQVLMLQTNTEAPEKFQIYWSIDGKYACEGEFTAQLITLSAGMGPLLRTKLLSGTPLPNMGFSDRALRERAKLYRLAGVNMVSAQLESGPNQGRRKLWEEAGFSFYGGGALMHVLIRGNNRSASPDIEDYLVDLRGRRAKGSHPSAYHMRLWCPEAVITPGRYPWKLWMDAAREEIAGGAIMLDADLETHIWNQCFCPACLAHFFRFSKLEPVELSPLELLRRYPMQWYRFRNEQTRLMYEQLRREFLPKYPHLRIGANTINTDFDKDLGDLKYGICHFGEDGRLLGDSVDFLLADTLTGSLADVIAVDTLKRSTGKEIIAVAGTSYCVGYNACVMAHRRETARMTGDSYGYQQRPQLQKLSMLHMLASGAAGLRVELDEASVVKATMEAAHLLSRMEDFYLDGQRQDAKLQVRDCTEGDSPWLTDKSRVRGGVWQHYYKLYHGQVQYRVHQLDEDWLLSLFNWDPFQSKQWHVALPELPETDYYLLDVEEQTLLLNDKKDRWNAGALKQGLSIEVPPAGYRLLRLSRSRPETSKQISVSSRECTKPLADPYAWYSGGQIDLERFVERALQRPLEQLERFGDLQEGGGGTLAAASTPAIVPVSLPFTAAFSPVQKEISVTGKLQQDGIYSAGKYWFASLQLPASGTALKLRLQLETDAEQKGSIGVILYPDDTFQVLQRLCWGKLPGVDGWLEFDIPSEFLQKATRLVFYNVAQQGEMIIRQLQILPEKQHE